MGATERVYHYISGIYSGRSHRRHCRRWRRARRTDHFIKCVKKWGTPPGGWAVFCSLWAACTGAHAESPTLDLGFQGAWLFGNSSAGAGNPTRALFYAQPAWRPVFEVAEQPIETQTAFRGWVNFHPGGTRDTELSVRALSVGVSRDTWRMVAGFQEVVWGETFGFPILDIINPRDWRDPLLLDPYWVRLPVATLNTQFFIDRTTLQLLFTPLPRSNLFPTPGSPIDPTYGYPGVTLRDKSTADLSRFGTSSEWGGRVSHLFEGGLDVGLMYLRHWNRNPVYELTPTSSGAGLVPVEQLMDTLGASLSYTLGENWVLRADQALHLGQPLTHTALGTLVSGTQWQSVLGADYTSSSDSGGQWTLGLQFQTTADWLGSGAGQNFSRTFKWLSARIQHPLFDGKLEPELFVFAGVGNPDLWIQPKITWNFGDGWSASLRADWIRYLGGGPADGYLWIARDQSRILLWVKWGV